MANLKLDFYESGRGDTILITFPDGSLGLVDAHPSPSASRPDIIQVIAGRPLRFVCLTHPHTDHAIDLVRVLESDVKIDEFWHTNSDVQSFIYHLGEVRSWSSDIRQIAHEFESAYANVFYDLYAAVLTRDLDMRQLRAGEHEQIAGVEIHILAPELSHHREVYKFWLARSGNPATPKPDPNFLSAVMALRWGDGVVLLGADALLRNWHAAIPRYRRLNLPKAVVLKVPHHGASNAYKPSRDASRPNYLDVCLTKERRCKSVLFAGDDKHPDKKVYDRLLQQTEVHCLINGLGTGKRPRRSLDIDLPGASPIHSLAPCQPVISTEIFRDGTTRMHAGHSCNMCALAP